MRCLTSREKQAGHGVDYKATLWRKSLERRGWKRLDKYRLPNSLIEFHIIHQGQLYSGRHHATNLNDTDARTPGTAAYVLRRRDLMLEGVWRRSSDQHAAWGMVCRSFP